MAITVMLYLADKIQRVKRFILRRRFDSYIEGRAFYSNLMLCTLSGV